MASKLGRTYRIPRPSLDLILWATRTRSDVTLRQYTGREIEEFLEADELDQEAQEIAKRFTKATERRRPRSCESEPRLWRP